MDATAVADNHGNTLNEFADRKQCREEENPQTLASPDHGATEKRRRRRKKINEESNEQSQVEVCPTPVIDSLFSQEENGETAADNPKPTPKEKKTKNVHGEQQLQPSDPSIAICVESGDTKGEGAGQDDANGNGGVCPNPLLDTSIPIAPREENAEATAQNSSPNPKKKKMKKNLQGAEQICHPSIRIVVEPDVTKEEGAQQGSERAETSKQNPKPIPKRKRRKNVQGEQQQLQTCDPSISINMEPDVKKEEGAQQGDANEAGVSGINEERPLPDSTAPEDTHCKKDSRRKRKKVLKPQEAEAESEPEPKESNSTESPQHCTLGLKPKNKMKRVAEANAENPGVCSKPKVALQLHIATPTNLEHRKRAEPIEAKIEHPQATTTPELESPIDMPTQMKPEKTRGIRAEKKKETQPSEPHAQQPQPQPCSNHELADVRGIDEECPAPDPAPLEDTHQKKRMRKKKNVLNLPGVEPPQPESEPKESNMTEHPQACFKSKLASPIDLPAPMTQKKKKELEPRETDVQHPQPLPCSKHDPMVPGINEEFSVPDPTPLEDTLRKKNWTEKKKNALKPQGAEPETEPEPKPKESNNTEHPEKTFPYSELKIKLKTGAEANAKHSQLCPKTALASPLDIATPNDSVVKKRTESTEAKVEDPQLCSKPKLAFLIDLPAPTNPEKKKEADPIKIPEEHAQHPEPQPCSAPNAEPPGYPTTPIGQRRRKQKNKRGREKIMCSEEKVEHQESSLHMDITLNLNTDLVQQDPATPIRLQQASLTGQTIPMGPVIPIDTEQKMKRKRKQRKIAVEGEEEPNHNKRDTEQPEVTIQKSTCLIEAPPIDPAIRMDHSLPIPICPANSIDVKQEISKDNRKKKRKSELKCEVDEPNEQNSEAAKPNEHNGKTPKAPPEAPVQKLIYPTAAPSIDPPINSIGPTPLIDTKSLIDQVQEMTKKKRRKSKRRNSLINEGEEPNDPDDKPPETPVQGFVYPIVAPSIDPTIPVQASPIDQNQKRSKKKRKRSALIGEWAEPNEHDDKPPGSPVQQSIYPTTAPSIEPTIPTCQASPVDPATPVDPEQMNKKKWKKGNSALKNELEYEEHNADPTAETPVQETEGPSAKKSMGRCNAELAAKTPIQRTESLTVTKSPLTCRACQQLGHRWEQCERLKNLSNDEEVCFFCGEIGHSFGNCGVSQAGGRRLAKCLVCYQRGHFSYNCPQSSYIINRKALVDNGAFNRREITSGKCSVCYKHGHYHSNCPQNGHRNDPEVLAATGAINRSVETKGQPLPEV